MGSQMVRFLIPKKNEWTEKEKGGFIFLCGLQTTNYVINYQGRGAPQRGGRGCGARSAPRGARGARRTARAERASAPYWLLRARCAAPGTRPGSAAPRGLQREGARGRHTETHARQKRRWRANRTSRRSACACGNKHTTHTSISSFCTLY